MTQGDNTHIINTYIICTIFVYDNNKNSWVFITKAKCFQWFCNLENIR